MAFPHTVLVKSLDEGVKKGEMGCYAERIKNTTYLSINCFAFFIGLTESKQQEDWGGARHIICRITHILSLSIGRGKIKTTNKYPLFFPSKNRNSFADIFTF
jgi:hypothetical protein